jgi:Transposase
MSMVKTPAITGGVDTHADTHVAAALDGIGGLLGVSEFATTPAGYARLLGWPQGFGTVCLVGIEGTGSYGAGLARHVSAAGIRVVEVDRSDRQDRRRKGKSDPLAEGRARTRPIASSWPLPRCSRPTRRSPTAPATRCSPITTNDPELATVANLLTRHRHSGQGGPGPDRARPRDLRGALGGR